MRGPFGHWQAFFGRGATRVPECRATFTFCGTVQGVGFRFTACRIANGFQVAGRVKNLADGSVRVVAEGSQEELAAFKSAILERMGGYVRSVEEDWQTATGEFSQFGVAF